MPGVSMMKPPSSPGSGNISANVVVCLPLSWTSDTSAVFWSSPGINALSSVDLPTPLWPLTR